MHFSRLAVVALPILGAAASVLPRNNGGCNGGKAKCCPQTISTNSLPQYLTTFFNLIGVTIGSIAPAVGLNCVSLVGQSCQTNTVCCTGNNYQDGLINISTGCTPIIL